MSWQTEPLKWMADKVRGASRDDRSRDARFRNEALPHLPAVTRYALSLTRDEADADDLVQETFLRAFRAWDQFVPGSECRAWLFTICRNTYLRTRRREQRVVAHDDADLEAISAAQLHATAERDGLHDLFTRADILDAVRAGVDELPDPFRDAVILVDLEENSYEETARILDVPKGTIRSRLFRGRRLLQERLLAHARDVGLAKQPISGEEDSNHG